MRIAVGCDHRGLDFKKAVMKLVTSTGHTCTDLGSYNTDAVDYPDIAKKVAEGVAKGEFERGILICNTGIGMSMAANKVKGIRASLCHDVFTATRARQHNDANIICLGTYNGEDGLEAIITAFLNTEFEGGRHQQRLEKITAIESGSINLT